jgi:O-acetylhomoserine (thiol)-lyase
VRRQRSGSGYLRSAKCNRAGVQHYLPSATLWHHPYAVRSPFAQPGCRCPICRVGFSGSDRKADRQQHAGGLLRAIEHGADIVVHSLTKFLGGHGTTLGGAIVDSGNFDWKEHAARFPTFNQPDASYHGMVYTDHFGKGAYLGRCRAVYARTTGAVLSPLSAFLLLQGIETVALRVERHVENARKVAEYLRNDDRIEWVKYAGFPDSPYYALTQKYLGGHACSLMTVGIKGGLPAAVKFYDALDLITRLVNLGDAKSLACHPASTTHRQMSGEEQRAAGIVPEMVRLSIGIEHVDDIIADLDQALEAAMLVTTKGETDASLL